MSELHFLNVRAGDAILIRHSSDRLSLIDICNGNYVPPSEEARAILETLAKTRGNFGMCRRPTNPIDYIEENFAGKAPFRFILTHPDMDHLDGFNALMDRLGIVNFWDSGVRKSKPDFTESKYLEKDWDRYVRVRDGLEPGVNVVTPRSGSRFKYANLNEDGSDGGDGLYVLAPDQALVDEANDTEDTNDGSYVLLYCSIGGRILIPGDAHDRTWEYVLEHYEQDVRNCSVLIAPHHGRKSGRSYDFLDMVSPKLTLFGCAPSQHMAYDAWNRRKLPFITNNQAGNVVLEASRGAIDVYVENDRFASAAGGDPNKKNRQGYSYLVTI